MKKAQDFLADFSNKVGLRTGGTIVLREREPKNSDDTNWVAAAGDVTDHAFAKVVADMRKRHPRIDWNDVKEREGQWRIIMADKKV